MPMPMNKMDSGKKDKTYKFSYTVQDLLDQYAHKAPVEAQNLRDKLDKYRIKSELLGK